MNPRIINQGDPKWANLPYRDLPYTVKSDGCGLCTVTMCAMELSKYWNYTPKDTIGFMRRYATNGNGTEWAGIDAGLDVYLGNHIRHYNMKSFWDEVSKGDRIGVILFGSNTAPDGTVWTKSGHYVMFALYKYENGQHWLYTKDSSYRHNDGWHSYEKSMRGCIPDVLWTAEVKDVKNGWKLENGSWHYYKNDVMLKDEWVLDKGKWYYFGKDGKMFDHAWCKWKGHWYFLNKDGAMAVNGWVKDSKGWCYVDKDGRMVSNTWVKYKGDAYYLGVDGYMLTGSHEVRCSFYPDGRLETK